MPELGGAALDHLAELGGEDVTETGLRDEVDADRT
jgi:hypothetical protein